MYSLIKIIVVLWSVSDFGTAYTRCPTVPQDCEIECIKFFWNENRKCSTCDCVPLAGTTELYEEDIKIDDKTEKVLMKLLNSNVRGAGNDQITKWFLNRNGDNWEIPYEIAGIDYAVEAINLAIADFHANTCIRFVQRVNEEKYIRFMNGGSGSCWSYVGVRSNGINDVSIGRGCQQKGIVIHELMHALGFWHEQSRPDRDNYVTILWDNIIDGKEHNFNKHTNIDSLGSKYDTLSVMHYSNGAFSKNGLPTIIPADGSDTLQTQREGFVATDIEQIKRMYCGDVEPTVGPTTATPCLDLIKVKKCRKLVKKNKCNSKKAKRVCAKTCGICTSATKDIQPKA
uniref:astacin-like n=1 Tax=Styela clava TaxID=7725 RepID=UPI00193ADA71|nr:astacin-like [Styela clava]